MHSVHFLTPQIVSGIARARCTLQHFVEDSRKTKTVNISPLRDFGNAEMFFANCLGQIKCTFIIIALIYCEIQTDFFVVFGTWKFLKDFSKKKKVLKQNFNK